MTQGNIIKVTEKFVKLKLKEYDSSHDWWHIERVRNIARFINGKETIADPFTLEVAVLLHDSADSKFAGFGNERGYSEIADFMNRNSLGHLQKQILEAIKNVSFSNKNPTGNLNDPVLLVLQDADKLDAIGAIGLARAFNYGGFRNNPIYIPHEIPDGNSRSTIGHFYDKLLRLKGMMNTATGRILAEERHNYVEKFLEQFYKEWDFGTV